MIPRGSRFLLTAVIRTVSSFQIPLGGAPTLVLSAASPRRSAFRFRINPSSASSWLATFVPTVATDDESTMNDRRRHDRPRRSWAGKYANLLSRLSEFSLLPQSDTESNHRGYECSGLATAPIVRKSARVPFSAQSLPDSAYRNQRRVLIGLLFWSKSGGWLQTALCYAR
jgi:hypothetical protein